MFDYFYGAQAEQFSFYRVPKVLFTREQFKDLEEMVRSINQSEVAPADRLSDFVYHYDSKERVFENARSFEARAKSRGQAEDSQMASLSTMTVLLVEPEKHPQVVEIGSDLKSLQSAVGGDFTKNIDSYGGKGTAEFASQAIELYCR